MSMVITASQNRAALVNSKSALANSRIDFTFSIATAPRVYGSESGCSYRRRLHERALAFNWPLVGPVTD
jgi:hypothetical protein